MNLPALMRGESSRLRRDTLDSAGCRQSRTRSRPWPARYRAGIASIPVLTHGVLFRDKQNTGYVRKRRGPLTTTGDWRSWRAGPARTLLSPERVGLAAFSQYLRALLEQLNASPEWIIGHSAGSALAAQLALDMPHPPHGLLCINAAFKPFGAMAAKPSTRVQWTAALA